MNRKPDTMSRWRCTHCGALTRGSDLARACTGCGAAPSYIPDPHTELNPGQAAWYLKRKEEREEVIDPWIEYWSTDPSRPPLCGLCGNTGVIDTRGFVRSPAGVACGIVAWCLCPMGRELKSKRNGVDPAAWRRLALGELAP